MMRAVSFGKRLLLFLVAENTNHANVYSFKVKHFFYTFP